MNSKVVFIHHRSHHHAKNSGYSRIMDFICGDYVPKRNNVMPYKLKKIISRLVSKKSGIYNSNSVEKEVQLIKYMFNTKKGVAHFLNGERDIHFSTYLKEIRKWKFIATFHQPPEILKGLILNGKYVNRLDAAIAVGHSQLEFLQNKIKKGTVRYIPHGVDTSFFTPAPLNAYWETSTCIFVGQHLRDFATLKACVEKLQKYVKGFKLRAVLRKDYIHLLPKNCNIEIYSGINDDQLKKLYQTSSFLLLPLENVTACNSLLEALACGIPIVTTNLESTNAYLNDSCAFLTQKGDIEEMVDASISLIENVNLNVKMRKLSRENSENFSWENISSQILQLYQDSVDY